MEVKPFKLYSVNEKMKVGFITNRIKNNIIEVWVSNQVVVSKSFIRSSSLAKNDDSYRKAIEIHPTICGKNCVVGKTKYITMSAKRH